MKAVIRGGLVAIALAACATHARTAAELKSALEGMAGGKIVRVAYVKGGPPQNFNKAKSSGIFVASSEDGVVRKIYPPEGTTGNYACPQLTMDGSKVFFYDYGRGEIVVVRFDGTFVRKFASDQLFDYYYDAQNNKDWAVVSNNTSITRRDIEAPATTATITTKLTGINVKDGDMMVSDDLTQIVCVKESSSGERVGLLDAATGNFVNGAAGCWPAMRSGSPIQFSQNLSGHRGPQLYSATGTKVQFFATSDTMDKFIAKNPSVYGFIDGDCTVPVPESGHASDGHRWSRSDRNYFTFYCARSQVNPILWRATDNKWIYIEEGQKCTFAGDMDVVFLSSVGTKNPLLSRVRAAGSMTGTGETYSIDGRMVKNSRRTDKAVVKGVSLVRTGNGIVRTIK